MGRDFVSPDDVKAVAAASLAHRIVLAAGVDIAAGAAVIDAIVERIAAPRP
jgi:MoxR-like ATPase